MISCLFLTVVTFWKTAHILFVSSSCATYHELVMHNLLHIQEWDVTFADIALIFFFCMCNEQVIAQFDMCLL